MPPRKKPSAARRSTTARAKPAAPRRARRPDPPARTRRATPRKPTLRKPTLRKPTQRKPTQRATEPVGGEVELVPADTIAAATQQAEERPVAIGGASAGADASGTNVEPSFPGGPAYPGAAGALGVPGAAAGEATPPVEDRAERYPQDVLVAVLSALLAASVFVPWYDLRSYGGRSTGLTGWETGTWGPAVFFLALGSLALAATRLAGIRVSLPLPHPTVHEGVGWVAIFAVLLKRLVRPVPEVGLGLSKESVGQTWWILAPILIGLALAFMAGRMYSGPPLVAIPNWVRGRAGKAGVLIIVLVLAGGAAFGLRNDTPFREKQSALLGRSGGGAPRPLQPITGRLPKCAKGFPLPSGAKPETAVEQTGSSPCVWTFNTTREQAALFDYYKGELPKNGYTFQVVSATTAFSTMTFSGSKCGNVSVMAPQSNAPKGSKSRGAIAVQPCPKTPVSPRASVSPSAK